MGHRLRAFGIPQSELKELYKQLSVGKWLDGIVYLAGIEPPNGEGNGNPLQCSCLENPRDGGAWWAAVYGVAQSRTRLRRLSSSSSTS